VIEGGELDPLRVLVSGAAGVLGSRLVAGLLQRGHTVRSLVLPGDPLRDRLADLGPGHELWEGDIREPASLADACRDVDTIYHLAAVVISHDPRVFRAVNRDGTAHLLAAADAARVRHFIYVSSASVTYPRLTPYAESKLEAEALVSGRSGGEYTIVRPTLVYDEGGGQELRMFLAYLRRFPIVPFIGRGSARKRPVWSEDVIDGLLRLCGNPVSHGKRYNLSGGESISMLEFARLLLCHHAAERPFIKIPVPAVRALAHALGLVMPRPPLTHNAIAGVINDADLDPSEAMIELGYHPVGVREGFRRCFPIPRGIQPESSISEGVQG
jgi:nucleoside-diphosphate-sugar epimerase